MVTTNENQEEINDDGLGGMDVGGTWMPDGLMFNIYSFLLEKDLESDDSDSLPPGAHSNLFYRLSFVSKDFLALLHRFVRRTSLVLNPNYSFRRRRGSADMNYEKIAWMCQKKVKLSNCHFYARGPTEAALFENIASSCDLSELKACTMHMVRSHCDSGKLNAHMDDIKHIRSHFHGQLKKEECVSRSPTDCQHIFADVPMRANSLRRLNLRLKGEWHLPLLMAFSNSLEILQITIFESEPFCQYALDQNLKELGVAIRSLTKLKKLKIRANFNGLLQIRSDSLEVIDTTGCKGFYIDSCICDSLKLFICDHKALIYSRGWSNGLKPIKPFSVEEMSMVGAGRNTFDVQVGSHPFVGLQTPKNCIVRCKT